MRWIMYDTKLFLSFREDIVSGGGEGKKIKSISIAFVYLQKLSFASQQFMFINIFTSTCSYFQICNI